MAKRFYISDIHYGHNNILCFDNRPFKDIDEMNEELVRRWNSVVTSDDIIYVLGDFFWCKSSDAQPVLDSLNGQKFLIKGNHDRTSDSKFIKKFAKVTDYLEVDDGNKHIVLCHYPIPCFKNHYYGWYHLYGHVHSSFEYNMMEHIKYEMETLYTIPCNMYNVGAMMPWMNYTPRTIDEIIEGYNKYGVN
jgi:calcineurin-like phosphoesterase family protein